MERRSRSDYPAGVLGIYDGGSKCADRYTVVYTVERAIGRRYFPYVGMSESPFHPQGVGMHGESRVRLTSRECGRAISFDDLPEDCKQLVRQDLRTRI